MNTATANTEVDGTSFTPATGFHPALQGSGRLTAVLTSRLLGAAVAVLGLSTVTGWLLHLPVLFEMRHGLVPMVFNTGLCFALLGVALASGSRRLARVLAMAAAAICAVTLAEIALGRSLLGIDLVAIHAWYDYGNTQPGRMAPNTAIGFLVASATLLFALNVESRRQAIALVGLNGLLLLIGVTGLIGYLLAPELLFNWAKSARMALSTASGMIILAISLWLSWSQDVWYTSEAYFREDIKIRMLASVILAFVTVASALTGFVFQQENVRSLMEARLVTALHGRQRLMRVSVAELHLQAQHTLSIMPTLDAGALAEQGWQRVLIERDGSPPKALLGPAPTDVGFIAALDPQRTTEILWAEGLRLRVRRRMPDGGVAVFERAVPELAEGLFATEELGATGEVGYCTPRGDELNCLPTRWRQTVFSVKQRPSETAGLPMQAALAGEGGVVQRVDYRQQNVIAAVGLLAPGFGITVKQDALETYGPIRQALLVGIPMVLLACAGGVMVMVWQLSPLVARMRRAEMRASDAAEHLRTVFDSAAEGIVTIDGQQLIQSANPAAGDIFGLASNRLRGLSFVQLFADPDQAGAMLQLDHHSLGHPPDGLRADGTRFPLECNVSLVKLEEQVLYVAMLRDVSVRREMEDRMAKLAQYDILTGLPNRALFMDRLATAALRAGRMRQPLAVMFLDLDGFKAINDEFGHGAGDKVLVETARRLMQSVRKTDTVARMGGDEFTIVVEQLADAAEDVGAIAKKILKAMQEPFDFDGRKRSVTASIGAAIQSDVAGPPDVQPLLACADDAMYEAKRAGKNVVTIRFIRVSRGE